MTFFETFNDGDDIPVKVDDSPVSKPKSLSPFDFISFASEQKKMLDFNLEEISKPYDNFMMNRFLSFHPKALSEILPLNCFDIPKESHYRYIFNLLPKQRVYINYIKKPKELNLNKDDERILIEYLGVDGSKDLEIVLNHLTLDEINDILIKYKKYGKTR